jgi:hypothetical protein
LKETDGSMAAAAAVYRRVLKAVQKHVGGGATKQHFRDFVAAEFRAPVGSKADARARLRLAGDYAYLLTSVQHHKVCVMTIRCAAFGLCCASGNDMTCTLSYEGGHVFDGMPRSGCVALLRVT